MLPLCVCVHLHCQWVIWVCPTDVPACLCQCLYWAVHNKYVLCISFTIPVSGIHWNASSLKLWELCVNCFHVCLQFCIYVTKWVFTVLENVLLFQILTAKILTENNLPPQWAKITPMNVAFIEILDGNVFLFAGLSWLLLEQQRFPLSSRMNESKCPFGVFEITALGF